MKIAVDVCIGIRGAARLRAAGHEVLLAEHAEADREWFARAVAWGVELVMSGDRDLEILCYDNRVDFYWVKSGAKARDNVAGFLGRLKQAAPRTRSRRRTAISRR